MAGGGAWPAGGPTVRVLGPLQVVGPTGPVDVGGRKPRALLALLLVHAGRVVSVDRLVDAVWGDRPPASADASLQTYVSRLRRALDGVAVIHTREPGYSIDVPSSALDVARAEVLVGEGRLASASGEHGRAGAVFREALALWRGRPFEEFADEDWARPESNRLAELRLAAWEDLADAELAAGRHRTLVGELEPVIAETPMREGLIARQVVALARSDRLVEALAVLRAHRELLRDELGLDPGPRLEQLERDLLVQAPDVVAGPPVAAVPSATEPPFVRTTGTVLVGRDVECADVARLVDELVAGTGGVVLVSGEAGIGKTSIARWCAERARAASILVIGVQATLDEEAPAWWPWRRALRELLDAVGTVDAAGTGADDRTTVERLAADAGGERGDADPYSQRSAVGRVVAGLAARRPVLFVVEDLHALDAASLGMLQFLGAETARAPIAIVATTRSLPPDPPRPLSACVDELARQPRGRWLRLAGLGPDAVAAVAAEAAGRPVGREVADVLHERTGGNPFLVRELARELALAGRIDDAAAVRDPSVVPATVQESVRRRIDALPDGVAEVVRLAAVAGGVPDVGVLAMASGAGSDVVLEALERACASELMSATGAAGALQFTHALVAEAAVAALGPVGRARRHQAVLDALRAVGGPGSIPAQARHALAALPVGDPMVALDCVEQAAQQAVERGAFDDAAAWWLHGLDLVGRVADAPPDTRWRLTDALARARMAAGDLRRGLATVLDACAEAERLADPRRLAESATGPVELSLWPWRGYGEVDHRMVRTLERALATLPADEPALRVRCLGGLAVERYYTGEVDAIDRASLDAVELARRHGDPALVALALDLRFVAGWRSDRMPELRRVAEELVEHVDATGLDDRTAFVAGFLRLVTRLTLGDVTGAAEDEARCLALGERLRTPSLLVALDGYRAMRSTLDGDHDAAERWIAAGLELYQRTQVWQPRDASVLLVAPIAVERGDGPALAASLLVDRTAPGFALVRRLACIVLAESGARDALLAELAVGGPLVEPARDWAWAANACGLAAVASTTDDAVAAATYVEQLAPFAGQLAMFGSDGCVGAVDEYRGRCLAVLDDDAAGDAFDAGADLHRRLCAPRLEARTRLHHAQWCLRRGDRGSAATLLDEAAELATGAAGLVARIAVARRAAG